MNYKNLRIGYVPYSNDLSHPGDRRRFVFFAKESSINFEIAQFNKEYDVLILTQAADLTMWSKYKPQKTKIIFDLIDSYLSINYFEIKALLRGLAKFIAGKSRHLELNYWNTLRKMCIRSDVVICSTQNQSDYISRYCDDVRIILDAQSSLVKKVKEDFSANDCFNIVWEGLPASLWQFQELKSVFKKLEKKYKIALHFITDLEYKHYSNTYGKRQSINMVKDLSSNVFVHEWDNGSLSEIICSFDLAIIPINLKDSLTRGKPENKLLLFWRMAMPVLTSSTPSYTAAMRGAGIDMTCGDNHEWFSKIEKCILNEEFRKKSGELGRAFVNAEHSDKSKISKWDKIFRDLRVGL
jgi:hypothetical protein